jgi:hypothetical protein
MLSLFTTTILLLFASHLEPVQFHPESSEKVTTWILFTDKENVDFSISHISERTLERRRKSRGDLVTDARDFQVNQVKLLLT